MTITTNVNPEVSLLEAKGDFAGRIQRTMRDIDMSPYVSNKNGLSYIGNADAWDTLKQHFPMTDSAIFEHIKHEDGSMTISCKLTIRDSHNSYAGYTRLAVTNYSNKIIFNPNASDIHNQEQRVRTKCIFETTGLGWEIYRGQYSEDGIISPQQLFVLKTLIKDIGVDEVTVALAYKVATIEELPAKQYDSVINALYKKATKNVSLISNCLCDGL